MRTLCVLLLLICVTSVYSLSLATVYTNNLVLQRDQENCLWGYGAKDEVVLLDIYDAGIIPISTPIFTVKNTTFYNARFNSTKFIICIPASVSSNKGLSTFNFNLNGSLSKSLVSVKNVVFGDVYFCSGQSNMGFSMQQTYDFAEIKNQTQSPFLRIYQSPNDASRELIENEKAGSSWYEATTAGWYGFSAVCFNFGVAYHNRTRVPVGLVGSYWGGTIIQAWMTNSTSRGCFDSEVKGNYTAMIPNNPEMLWNGMVYPLLGLTVNGFLWYQGEQNSGNPIGYECMLINMIKLWRDSFAGKGIKPFGIVELSPMYGGTSFVALRSAQALVAETVEHSFVVTTVDMGDPTSPYGAVHSRNKTLIGHRAASLMLHQLGMLEKGEPYSGPVATGCCIETTMLPPKAYKYSRVRISLDFAEGVNFQPTPACGLENEHCCNTSFITVALKSNQDEYATETSFAENNDVIVDLKDFVVTKGNSSYSLTNGKDVVSTFQHAWVAYPQCVLWNKYVLPSYPFNISCTSLCATSSPQAFSVHSILQ